MQLLQLGVFFAAMTALVVCGCILTRKPRKKLPMKAAQTVPDEHAPGCFALEPAVSLLKKKGAVIGQAAAYPSLMKLGRVCDQFVQALGRIATLHQVVKE
jgi:hypothetical protein